jgi:hypothetical protein
MRLAPPVSCQGRVRGGRSALRFSHAGRTGSSGCRTVVRCMTRYSVRAAVKSEGPVRLQGMRWWFERVGTLVVPAATLAVCCFAACGARSLEPGVANDGGRGMDSSVGQDIKASEGLPPEPESLDGTAPHEGGDNILFPIPSPPASDDQRLGTFLSPYPGATPDGWDLCQSPTPLSRAPKGCDACPVPSQGTSYLRYSGSMSVPDCGAGPGQVCPPQSHSQIYAYFIPPLTADEPQGFWFDLIHISGDTSDATLTIYATDQGCGTLESLGIWQLADALSGAPGWRTVCAMLHPSELTQGLGFRFSGSQVDLGFGALRFGPACPAH